MSLDYAFHHDRPGACRIVIYTALSTLASEQLIHEIDDLVEREGPHFHLLIDARRRLDGLNPLAYSQYGRCLLRHRLLRVAVLTHSRLITHGIDLINQIARSSDRVQVFGSESGAQAWLNPIPKPVYWTPQAGFGNG